MLISSILSQQTSWIIMAFYHFDFDLSMSIPFSPRLTPRDIPKICDYQPLFDVDTQSKYSPNWRLLAVLIGQWHINISVKLFQEISDV